MKYKLEIDCNFKSIMEIINCSEKKQKYQLYKLYYEEIMDMLKSEISPTGYFKIENNNNNLAKKNSKNFEALCFITLGHKIDEQLTKYYSSGDFDRALLLSNIADEILQNASQQLRSKLMEVMNSKNHDFSEEFIQYKNNTEENLSKYILDKLRDKIDLETYLANNSIISPSKSKLEYYFVD